MGACHKHCMNARARREPCYHHRHHLRRSGLPLLDSWTLSVCAAGKGLEEQVSDLMLHFLRRKYVTKTERKFKKPKPGKKGLIKFPKTLEPHAVSALSSACMHASMWPGSMCACFHVACGSAVDSPCACRCPEPTARMRTRVVCMQDPNGWTEGAFYAWRYNRPTSMWVHVGTVALPVVVVGACLFPLAPW